jgi:hypothetical protein
VFDSIGERMIDREPERDYTHLEVRVFMLVREVMLVRVRRLVRRAIISR